MESGEGTIGESGALLSAPLSAERGGAMSGAGASGTGSGCWWARAMGC